MKVAREEADSGDGTEDEEKQVTSLLSTPLTDRSTIPSPSLRSFPSSASVSPASGQTDLETFPQPPAGVYTHYTRRRTSATRLDSVVDLADTLTFPDPMSSTTGNRGPKPSSFSGDVNEENPEQFWREVEEYLSGETETAKCARFQNLLRARSAADVWYKQLAEEVRASWSRLKGAYDKEFVSDDAPQISDTDMLHILLHGAPDLENVLTHKDTQSGTLSYHKWWKNQLRVAVMTKGAGEHLAEQVRKQLLPQLRKYVPAVKSWRELYDGLEKVEISKLQDEVDIVEQVVKLTLKASTQSPSQTPAPAPASTTATVATVSSEQTVTLTREQFTQLLTRQAVMAPPNPVSAFPNNTYAPARPFRGAAPQGAPADRLATLRRNALEPPANNEEGRKLYEQQIADWHAKNEGLEPNEHRPYPLTPGTLPVTNARTCWTCGLDAHGRSGSCNNVPVKTLENRWRVEAGRIINSARAIHVGRRLDGVS